MKRKRLLINLAVGFVAGVLAFTGVAAAQDITRTYNAEDQLQRGTIVGFREDEPEWVEPLRHETMLSMLGVVVPGNEAPITLSSGDPDQEVFVASQGSFNVLVSDQGGPIRVGDYITISALAGVGMRADERQELIVGVALEQFDPSERIESSGSFTDSEGQERQVSMGRIRADVRVVANPLYVDAQRTGVPGFMSRVADIVTDEPVSALRLYTAFSVLLITMFVAGGILFSGTRKSMLSFGRNPLARHSIVRGLTQVVLISITVFIIGLVAVYLLLTL